MRQPLLVVSPWYPSPMKPFRGSFVRANVHAVHQATGRRVDVLATDEWMLPGGRVARRRAGRAFGHLLRRQAPTRMEVAHGSLTRVPTPVPASESFAQNARDHERAVHAAFPRGLHGALVHAHTVLPGGWAATRNLRDGARLFLTEHATYLDRMFAQRDSRRMYGEALARSEALFCVGERLRSQVVEAFPEHAAKVHLLPNPLPFASIAPRTPAPASLDRWVFAGSLIERKGVAELLEAFAIAATTRPSLRLTYVGGGPLHDDLSERARELGVAERVTMLGPVPPDDIFDVYRAHDLLVHPSRFETFGITMVEAVACGLPVLATRNGGSDETLGPVEHLVGRLVPLDAGVPGLVDGFEQLEARLGDLDLVRGRAELAAKYSYDAVAAQLTAYYDDERVSAS